MKSVLQMPYRSFMNMKLFHKFILIYVLVILLPTSILEMSLYRQSAKSVRDQYTLNESNALEGAEGTCTPRSAISAPLSASWAAATPLYSI